MSPTSVPASQDRFDRLPTLLRPRAVELPGSGQTRLIETALLVLVGLLLALATVNDVVRQAGVNHRLTADLRTWRSYTGHYYHNLSIDQELLGVSSSREVVCGNTKGGPPKSTTQLCLVISGPVVRARRTVEGGWYLPPKVEDGRADRYGCFGLVTTALCPR
jgi:hypothetical protein